VPHGFPYHVRVPETKLKNLKRPSAQAGLRIAPLECMVGPLVGPSSSSSTSPLHMVPHIHTASGDGGRLCAIADTYKGHDEVELRFLVAERDCLIGNLIVEKSNMQKSRDYHVSRCQDFTMALQHQKQQSDDLLKMVRYRVNRNVSVWGGYSLAIRRNIGYASAADTVLMIAGDELHGAVRTKHVVFRYEHNACLVQRLKSQDWFSNACASMSGAAIGMTIMTGPQMSEHVGDVSMGGHVSGVFDFEDGDEFTYQARL
jgi:hypothetical protein